MKDLFPYKRNCRFTKATERDTKSSLTLFKTTCILYSMDLYRVVKGVLVCMSRHQFV